MAKQDNSPKLVRAQTAKRREEERRCQLVLDVEVKEAELRVFAAATSALPQVLEAPACA